MSGKSEQAVGFFSFVVAAAVIYLSVFDIRIGGQRCKFLDFSLLFITFQIVSNQFLLVEIAAGVDAIRKVEVFFVGKNLVSFSGT